MRMPVAGCSEDFTILENSLMASCIERAIFARRCRAPAGVIFLRAAMPTHRFASLSSLFSCC
jgi:hypothetical protein